ncbi:hypothetical protein PN462_07060 [Spirulina sp. CS-785/01]|uniref:hypothetical protein n=1 Tax=Spirulina sp. CS-785/01 TaxID=3021716 RepID=UPI00232C16AE|nr:hypothetical protein [Spirulina sp. CS-785/01]MDB9312855.1 hypothetical protein [Spirulina sp. CS-785/01]
MTKTGKIEYRGVGLGAWALVTDTGETYELQNAPESLQQEGINVKVDGKIREDIMTVAMIGPVFEVDSFEVI